MEVLRTPEPCFADLPGFPYEPHYGDVPDGDGGSLRMAWVEDGPAEGPVVLLLHGEPTWSFLYRNVMPVLAGAGLRAVAPDLVGFGRSDKPAGRADHTYLRHVNWVRALVFDVLDLRAVTLVGHDWGGLIGLRLVAENPDRFARVAVTNTGLPTGDRRMAPEWHAFRDMVGRAEILDVGRIVQSGSRTRLAAGVRAAYDAPFPDESYKAGPRVMPYLVPTTPDDPATGANRAAWQRLAEWRKPFLVAFSDSDPMTTPMAPVFRKIVPGAAELDHPMIAGAGHFVPEDAGTRLGEAVARFVAGSPSTVTT